MFYWTLLIFSLTLSSAKGYHHCYECSSKSALCRNSVYDGQYLTKTPCQSVCFYRNEDNRVYRGCFDGWKGGIVRSNYLGCQIQHYLGEKVEWCFCNNTTDGTSDQPCNGAHRDIIAKFGQSGEKEEINEMKDRHEMPEKEEDAVREKVYSLHSHGKHLMLKYRTPEGRELTLKKMKDSEEQEEETEPNPGERYEDDASQYVTSRPKQPTSSPCEGRYDGMYPDITDCSRYIICSRGRLYWMRCSAGTVWDDNLQSCVFFAHHVHLSNPCVLPKRFKHFQYFQDREPIEVYDVFPSDDDAYYESWMRPND